MFDTTDPSTQMKRVDVDMALRCEPVTAALWESSEALHSVTNNKHVIHDRTAVVTTSDLARHEDFIRFEMHQS